MRRPGRKPTTRRAAREHAAFLERVREAMALLDGLALDVARVLGGRCDVDDLKGHAHESVIDVATRFDPSFGVPFRAYARRRLRGAMIDGVRRDSELPRGIAVRLRELESGLGQQSDAEVSTSRKQLDRRVVRVVRGLNAMSWHNCDVALDQDELEANEVAPTPEERAIRRQVRAVLEQALDGLGQEGTLLRIHYFRDEDLQAAATRLGLSKSWGSRLHARGIRRLARRVPQLRGALH